MAEKRRYTKAEIASANKTDIVSYCQKIGIALNQISDDQYRGVEHDSLVITASKNAFFWNSTQQHGTGALDFSTKYEQEAENIPTDKRFRIGMKRVIESGAGEFAQHRSIQKAPFKLDRSQFDQKFTNSWAYLTKPRGISAKIVDQLHKQGLIKQDKMGNAIFIWKDPQNQAIKGASKQGTRIDHQRYGKRGTLKQIEKNSSYGYGWSFKSLDLANKPFQPTKMIFTEAPIDAISYYNCHTKAKDTLFVSMEGLKKEVFYHYVKMAGKNNWPVKQVSLAVDNDEAGDKFVQAIRQGDQTHPALPNIRSEQPDKQFGKDWNDVLKNYRQGQVRTPSKPKQMAKTELAKKHALVRAAARER